MNDETYSLVRFLLASTGENFKTVDSVTISYPSWKSGLRTDRQTFLNVEWYLTE